MKNNPLISVVLPVCNSEKTLTECLKSIKAQTYRNIEIIAIDDRSTDQSFKTLKLFKKRDKRFRVYRNKKRYGLSMTLNRCLRRCKGDYIAFADSSCKFYLNRIKKQFAFLSANSKVAAVGSQLVVVNDKGRKIRKVQFPTDHDSIYKSLVTGSAMAFETVMIDKKSLPNDILKVKKNPGLFLFIDLFMKISQFGEIANLTVPLNYKKEEAKTYLEMISGNKQISFIKQIMKYITLYDYRPSLKSLLLPTIKPV